MIKYIIYPVIHCNETKEWVVSVRSAARVSAIHALVHRSLWYCLKWFFMNIPRYLKYVHKKV